MGLYFPHFGEGEQGISGIFSHTNNLSRMEFLKVFTDAGAGIITQCAARKKAKILDYVPDHH